MTGIPSAPRGVPQIEVTFDIDANGIVNVSAKDLGTGKEQKITISGSTALSDEEVDRMVSDAKEHEEEDEARKNEVEVRNQADSLVYATEKTIKDLGDKVPETTKSQVEDAIAALKTTMEGDDIDAIKTKTEELQQASYQLAQIAYGDMQGQAGAAGATGAADQGAASAEDDVVDADYEVVDDDKKE